MEREIDGAEPILVTGAAGFIGFHVAQRLAAAGRAVIGIDTPCRRTSTIRSARGAQLVPKGGGTRVVGCAAAAQSARPIGALTHSRHGMRALI